MGNFNADPNPLPEKMDLFYIPNTLRRLGRLAGKLFMHLPDDGYPSERGAEAMLEQHLYLQPPLPFDSEGNWHNPDGI